MRTHRLLVAGAAIGAVAIITPPASLEAQRAPSSPGNRPGQAEPMGERWFSTATSGNRAVIGVLLSDGGAADTLGVRVEEVTPESPAAGAGIRAGDRIVAVNGRDVRLSASEARDPAQQGLAVRRVTREIGDVKSGAAVTLRVRSGDADRTVTMRAVPAETLTAQGRRDSAEPMLRIAGADSAAAIGLSAQATGTLRDTLGTFVASVVPGGPAERAGIYEGDRIVAVGGVDLRVRRADADDPYVARLKADQLTRAIREASIGQPLTVRVWRGGQERTIQVTPAPSVEVYAGQSMGNAPFSFDIDGSGIRIRAGGDGTSLRRMIVPTPRGTDGGVRIYRFEDGDTEVQLDGGLDSRIRERMNDVLRRFDVRRDSTRTQIRVAPRAEVRTYRRGEGEAPRPAVLRRTVRRIV